NDEADGEMRCGSRTASIALVAWALAWACAMAMRISGELILSQKKNHAVSVQQRNVRSFQPAPPGPVSKTRVNGARTMAKNPKIRRLSVSQLTHLVQHQYEPL